LFRRPTLRETSGTQLGAHPRSRFFHRVRNTGIATALAALVCTAAPSSAWATPTSASFEAKPFTATYSVRFMRIRAAEVTFDLKPATTDAPDDWVVHRASRARGLAKRLAKGKVNMDEHSWFTWEDGKPVASRFEMRKPGDKPGRRSLDIDFDKSTAYTQKDGGNKIKVTADAGYTPYDQVSAVIALMHRMSTQPSETFQLAVVNHKGVENLGFKVIGSEKIKTKSGTYDTIHVRQASHGYITNYWLAKDRQMVPVKITHQDKGKDPATMTMDKLSFQSE